MSRGTGKTTITVKYHLEKRENAIFVELMNGAAVFFV